MKKRMKIILLTAALILLVVGVGGLHAISVKRDKANH